MDDVLNDLGRSHDESLPHGVEDDLGRVVKVQLLHEIGPVRLHRRQAEIEQIRHFLVRSTFREQLEHLLLAVGEQMVGISQSALLQLPNVIFDQDPCDGGTEEWLPRTDRPHRRD